MQERIPAAETISAATEGALAQLGVLQLTDQTARATARFWVRFTSYAEGAGIATVSGIGPDVVRGFIGAKRAGGELPSTSTMHSRRSAVRLLFRIWRELAVMDGDPTLP